MKKGRKPFSIELLVERGRFPSDWKEKLLEIGRNGGNQTDMLLLLNVSRGTLYRLMERSPDFLNTVNRAMEYSEQWWYNIAKMEWIRGNSKSINSNHWSLIMRNQFGDRWSDRKEHDITSKGEKINNDNTINVEIIKPDKDDEDADNSE
jgi:hypothetical protein